MVTDFDKAMSHDGSREFSHGTVSVIVPVRNAEKYVNRMIAYIRSNWKSSWGALEIVIADDCSSDKTVELAEIDANLVVSTRKRSGVGACIRQAMDKARGDYRLVVYPSRVKEIDRAPIFLEWLRTDYDMVMGNRFASSKQKGYRGNLLARIARRIADESIAPGISDLRSGFKGYTRRSGKYLYDTSSIDGLGTDAEIAVMAFRAGLNIKEVPLVESDSPPVVETMSFTGAFKLLWDSYRVKSSLRKRNLVPVSDEFK